jgi:transposase-like protein
VNSGEQDVNAQLKESKRNKYTREEKEAAVREWEAGGNAAEIGDRMGVSAAAIYWWQKQMKKGWKGGSPYPSGHKKKKKKAKGKQVAVVPTQVVPTSSRRNAILCLNKAKQELIKGIKTGRINDLDNAHLMSLLALNALQDDS